MQFLDNHDSWGLEKVLGVVTDACVEDVESGDADVVDVKLSKREGVDDILQRRRCRKYVRRCRRQWPCRPVLLGL